MKKNKVLVTGSSGFIASHIVDLLDEKGYEVILFDSVPSKYKSIHHKEIIGDILRIDDINKAIKDCSAVFHFAAQADIDLSNDNPYSTIESNIMGTQNVLEASRKNEVNRFIFASSIYVYGELGSFYRVSKQSCEKIIEEYSTRFSLPYTIVRYGSLYGERANEDNGLYRIIFEALTNQKISYSGDGEEIREYIHASDAAILSVNIFQESSKPLIRLGIRCFLPFWLFQKPPANKDHKRPL